ncbi:MAG TPA: tetratricopeptide repeat protein [Treponemataceae bacterium]|nr:tetratricopeptide repeat protein [Treponemataceae bacterium]
MSDERDYLLHRAKKAVVARDFSLAERLYKGFLRNNPHDIPVLSELGSVYVRSGKDTEALDVYQKIIEKDGGNFNALNSLAGIYRRLKRYDESIAVLETALVTGEDDNAVYYNMGYTYKLMGNKEEGAKCFQRVIDENPNDVLAYNHLGSIQAARGEHAKALNTYAKALQLDKNHPILHYNAAKSYIALGNLSKAKNSYENALRAHPGWIDAMDAYARLLMKMNLLPEAEDILLQAQRLDKDNLAIKNALGLAYFKRERYTEANRLFNDVLRENKKDVSALLGKSAILSKTRKMDAASVILSDLEKKHPDNHEVCFQYSELLVRMNKLLEAVKRINHLYAENPNDPDLLNLISQYAIRKGEEERVQDFVDKIAQSNPTYTNHFFDIAEVYFEMQKLDKAEYFIRSYLEKQKKDSKAYVLMGKIYEVLKNYRKALEHYKKGVDLNPYSKEAETLLKRVEPFVYNSEEKKEEVLDENKPASEYLGSFNIDLDEEDDFLFAAGEGLGDFLDEGDLPIADTEMVDNEETIVTDVEPTSEDFFSEVPLALDEDTLFEEPLDFDLPFEDEDLVDDNDNIITIEDLIDTDAPFDENPALFDDPLFDDFGSSPTQYLPDEEAEVMDVLDTPQGFTEDSENDKALPKQEEFFSPPPIAAMPQAYPPYEEKMEIPQQQTSPMHEKEKEIWDEEPLLKESGEELFLSDGKMQAKEEAARKPEERRDRRKSDTELEKLKEDYDSLGNRFDKMRDRYDKLRDSQDELRNRFSQLEDNYDDLDDKYAYLSQDADLIEDIKEDKGLPESDEIKGREEAFFVDTEPGLDEDFPVETKLSDTNIHEDEIFSVDIGKKEGEGEDKVEQAEIPSLFENLEDLCAYLPEKKKNDFLTSIERLKMHYLMQKMLGGKGLLLKSEDVRNEAGMAVDQLDKLDADSVLMLFFHLQNLTTELRDKQLGALLYEKLSEIKEACSAMW